MEIYMMVIGKMIFKMEKEFIFLNQEKLNHMKEIGVMDIILDLEK
jgi:hypothetical protein